MCDACNVKIVLHLAVEYAGNTRLCFVEYGNVHIPLYGYVLPNKLIIRMTASVSSVL